MKILKNSLIIFSFCLVAGLLLSGYIFKEGDDIIIEKDLLENLSLEQKIGQLFIIGIEGKELDEKTERLMREVKPGGILLLGRNIDNKEQLKRLVSSLQEISLAETGFPLFVAADQEGGLISRLSWVESTPQSEVGDGYEKGLLRGKQLKESGVNLNLAPLVEKAFPSDFIYERSFQAEDREAIEKASGLVRGQKEAGILTCVKHFPGYTGIDFNPEEDLAFKEKIPSLHRFREVLKEGPEMVMISNAVYGDEIFSKNVFNLLNSDLVVITDDLSQNSLLKEFSLKEIVVSPFLAGSDILLFSGWRSSVEEGVEAFKEAFEEGKIAEERIDSSVLKILELKNEI